MTTKSASYLTNLRQEVAEVQRNIGDLSDVIDGSTFELLQLTPMAVRREQELVDEYINNIDRARKELGVQLKDFKTAVKSLREFF